MSASSTDKDIKIKWPDSEPRVDWWSRLGVISSLLSSVVIAGIGIYLSSSIQRSQLASTDGLGKAQVEIARLKNQEDSRLEESKLTEDLIQHLLSNDAKHRAVAITVLHRTVSAEMYDDVVAVLARPYPDPHVRT